MLNFTIISKQFNRRYQPFGVVLILGAWNYPLQLTIVPMVIKLKFYYANYSK